MENENKVYEFMKNTGEALRQGQIIEATGLSKNDVAKALKSLKEQGKVYTPKRCFVQAK